MRLKRPVAVNFSNLVLNLGGERNNNQPLPWPEPELWREKSDERFNEANLRKSRFRKSWLFNYCAKEI
jgi:hypothetical protein